MAAFVVWVVCRERSPAVARHATGGGLPVRLARRAVRRLIRHPLSEGVRGRKLLWQVMGVLMLAYFGHALYEAYPAYRGDGVFGYH